MKTLRYFSTRHSRFFESLYKVFERALVFCHPVFKRIGYDRLEKPVAVIERATKGLLFDSQMCGMCTLSSSGMTCPMNCPKKIRNGPCGGVRANGNCEVEPDMPCVWVEAYNGSQRMKNADAIRTIQEPVDHRLIGSSSWLREVRHKTRVTSEER